MKKKKKIRVSKPLGDAETPVAGRHSDGTRHTIVLGPSEMVKTCLSIGVAVHLIALAISFTAVVEPSSVQQRLSDLLQPYLRPTHFSADDLPVYLTHGDSDDQPHRIEVTTQRVTGVEASGDVKWQVIGPAERGGFASIPGFAVSDRVARWLSTAAILAENEQPSLIAELILPIVANRSSVQGVRIVRYPTDLNEVNVGVSVPYLARVVRAKGGVSLVQLKEKRLSAQPRFSFSEPASMDDGVRGLSAPVLASTLLSAELAAELSAELSADSSGTGPVTHRDSGLRLADTEGEL
jgi:hypothetical protein